MIFLLIVIVAHISIKYRESNVNERKKEIQLKSTGRISVSCRLINNKQPLNERMTNEEQKSHVFNELSVSNEKVLFFENYLFRFFFNFDLDSLIVQPIARSACLLFLTARADQMCLRRVT